MAKFCQEQQTGDNRRQNRLQQHFEKPPHFAQIECPHAGPIDLADGARLNTPVNFMVGRAGRHNGNGLKQRKGRAPGGATKMAAP